MHKTVSQCFVLILNCWTNSRKHNVYTAFQLRRFLYDSGQTGNQRYNDDYKQLHNCINICNFMSVIINKTDIKTTDKLCYSSYPIWFMSSSATVEFHSTSIRLSNFTLKSSDNVFCIIKVAITMVMTRSTCLCYKVTITSYCSSSMSLKTGSITALDEFIHDF